MAHSVQFVASACKQRELGKSVGPDQHSQRPHNITFDLGEKSIEASACVESTRCSSAESTSRASLHDHAEELSPNLSSTFRKVELDKLAIVIACAVQSKLQTCKFSGFRSVRLYPVYEHLRNVFQEIDSDCDGKLTNAETHLFWKQFNLPSESASRFFTLLDGDTTGFVNWEAFLARYAPLFTIKS
eukprot:gnl/MRDRNA2_/MRDRNA2_100247_c0_seq1.p1 gnl/MRDRNA2_/MRDRNA2_100247_c0~~gnl/MRDRNA2_/MRDRNA2_100247_c0_seq1.p1  ORF type:complete len:186 (-),score=21.22 gnl/MRDRNA2_/MRDRNA2_100247_c0_seq1:210-767(-)